LPIAVSHTPESMSKSGLNAFHNAKSESCVRSSGVRLLKFVPYDGDFDTLNHHPVGVWYARSLAARSSMKVTISGM